jgi:uncharacterized protein YbaP (TraB family)
MRLFLFFLVAFNFLSAKFVVTDNIAFKYWQISKGNTTSYLIGTMHIGDYRVKKIVDKLTPLIKQSNALYTEIKLNPFTKMLAFKATVLDGNKTLKDLLEPKLYKELDNYLKTLSPYISAKNFNKFKIWAVAVSLPYINMQKGFKSIDESLYNKAFLLKKEVGGIESLDEQISIFDNLSYKEQANLLKDTLKWLKKYPGVTRRLINYYFNAKFDDILKLNKKFFNEFKNEKIENEILYKRNEKMAKRIDNLISKNPNKKYIFAFGLLHFLGKKSIIEFLEAKGYNIKEQKIIIHREFYINE